MNIILQITAGRGPAECGWVVIQVFKLLLKEIHSNGFDYSVIHKSKGAIDHTWISVAIEIEGDENKLTSFTKSWIGTIQWIGQSTFRKNHKRKNWFVGINRLDLEDQILQIDEKNIQYEATRSGGPGGQHVNKVSTAVRATHKTSGLAVLASNSRSQMQNKKAAKERLIQVLKLKQFESRKAAVQSNWQNHNELERGNPIRVFKGSNFKSEYVSKNYKSKRQKQKLELKKLNFKD